MIAVSYHDTVNVLQALALAERPARAPFDRAAWFTLLAEHRAAWNGGSPLFVLAREGDAFAMLPLMTPARDPVALANWYSFTWRPVASDGADLRALGSAAARELIEPFARVTLAPIPDEDGTAADLQNAFDSIGWRTFLTRCDTNHFVRVAGRSYAEYLASRPGPLRTTLKRKRGKVETEIFTHFESSVWGSYEEIYARSWKPEEGAPALLRAFAEVEGAAGRLRLGLARHEGRAVAAQLWTVENGTAFIHKLAHLDHAAKLSAGTVLTAALMEHAIDRDAVAEIDFGTGDEPYKRDWMEDTRPRWRLDCFDPRKPRAWLPLAKARLRQLASRGRPS